MFIQEGPHALLDRECLTESERAELLEGYVTRGRAFKLDDDRGLIDSHRRREGNLAQFFTPTKVARIMAQAVGLIHHPGWDEQGASWLEPQKGSIVDFAGCGNGRLLQFAPSGWTRHGADVDPLACRAAKLIYPDAEVIEGSLLEFRNSSKGQQFTLAMVNPPFSITLNAKKPLPLNCAQWGVRGQNTSVQSHVAAVEIACRMASVVVAILPTSALVGDEGRSLARVLRGDRREGLASLKLRLDLPLDAFKSEGTEWPTSIAVFGGFQGSSQTYSASDWDEVDTCLTEWISTQQALRCAGWDPSVIGELRKSGKTPALAAWRVAEEEAQPRILKVASVECDLPKVRLALGGRAHRVMMKPNGLIAALAVEEARLWEGWITENGFDPQNSLDWACDLVRNAGDAEESIWRTVRALKWTGVHVDVDAQLLTHARRADKRAAAELTSFSQWIRRGDEWIERGRDTSGKNHPAHGLIMGRHRLYNQRAQQIPEGLTLKSWDKTVQGHVERRYPAFPMYAFSRKDVGRSLSKRGVIYSAKQGLGKTRFSIGAVLASGVDSAVWVLESRLINEFKRELKRIGLLEYFHQIEKKEDLKNLKLINVISLSRIWRPVSGEADRREVISKTWGPGKSFAAALAKRRITTIVDEAHKIKGATSKQGVAVRLLCHRARRVILMTGTAIASYPRNILGLVNAGWGDGSSMNPYGYRRLVEGGYWVDSGRSSRRRGDLMRGVSRFVDENVDLIWFTPAFDQTASTGMKSREIPRLKDVGKWTSFVQSKIIRRVPGEPEVRESGLKTPEAKPQFVPVAPSEKHFAFYKLILDRFADIWRDRIARERDGGASENNAAHILPELDALRFGSTVPIREHRWAKEFPELRYMSKEPTALMRAALERIAKWVEEGGKVVVGAEKPDALKWLADLLADLPTYIPDSEPIPCVIALDSDIKKRNAAIDRARDEGEAPVLLLTVGMGKEGLNLPEFDKLLTLDLGWIPADLDQYRHRILRPDQAGDPEIVHLYHEGMIDSYMRQLCDAKSDAIAQAIDGQGSEFDYSNWKDFRTFALEMLEKEGYAFAAEVMRKERASSLSMAG